MAARNVAVFIGNSIFGDDRIGLIIGNNLKDRVEKLGFDVHIIERTGFALLDCLEGYENAVVVDSVCTKRNHAGEVLSLSVDAFSSIKSRAAHFSGVPEAVQLMKELGLDVPNVVVLGIAVKNPYDLSTEISDDLRQTAGAISNAVYSRILALASVRNTMKVKSQVPELQCRVELR